MEFPSRYDKRNFYLNLFEGGSYVAGASLISTQTVLPALIDRLGGSNVAIGSLGVITWCGLFLPQVFAARYGETLEWKKPWVIGYGAVQRIIIIALGIIIFIFGNRNAALTLGLFLFLYALFQIITGITTPVWFDFYAKLTPLNRRGRLIGMRSAFAGALAFFCSFALTWVLATFSFPLNYSIVFFTAFLFMFVSFILQSQIIEEHPSRVMPRKNIRSYILHDLPAIIRRNRSFRHFLLTSSFFVLSSVSSAFFTVYAIRNFNATSADIGRFTIVMVVGQIIGSLFNGYVADHFGNRIAMFFSTLSALLASLLAILAPSLTLFHVVFFLTGINSSEIMIRYNLGTEYGPIAQRSTYIGLMNTVLAPLYLVGLFGGWMSNVFGYITVFWIGAGFSLVGIVMLWILVKEPRGN